MAQASKIEWTDHTFNPWHGCTKVSAGCANCYAATLDNRNLHDAVGHWGPGAQRMPLSDTYWRQPQSWNRRAAKVGVPARVFCASMADVFDDEGLEVERERLWRLIDETPWLDWQLLTKRPQNIPSMIPPRWQRWIPSNVWVGASVEGAEQYGRIEALLRVPAAVRFLSLEPLIGPVEGMPLAGIDWVIAGGESGPGARPMHPAWAASARDQALDAGVAFFFKQWGAHRPLQGVDEDAFRRRSLLVPSCLEGVVPIEMVRMAKRDAGRLLEGRTWDEFPYAARRHLHALGRQRRVAGL